ncbi:MAG: hypothetical protein Q8K88_08755 [Bradyrhizobium sp.]|nr:hypothetical protein [Bradyrhizobium sp.]
MLQVPALLVLGAVRPGGELAGGAERRQPVYTRRDEIVAQPAEHINPAMGSKIFEGVGFVDAQSPVTVACEIDRISAWQNDP